MRESGLAMAMLHHLGFVLPDGHVLTDDDPPLLIYCRPGMNQLYDGSERLALTAEDREFLRRLGIVDDSSIGSGAAVRIVQWPRNR
jgi:hypothetical protein